MGHGDENIDDHNSYYDHKFFYIINKFYIKLNK